MNKALAILLQVFAFAVFALVIGYFATAPEYRYGSPGDAVLKLSLSHAADRVKPCVRLTPTEIAALPPNMRQPEKCERERLPLTVQLLANNEVLVHIMAEPSGLWNDGPASVYKKISLPAGDYALTARLRATNRAEGWDFELSERVTLQPGRYFTVTFREETGGFRFK